MANRPKVVTQNQRLEKKARSTLWVADDSLGQIARAEQAAGRGGEQVDHHESVHHEVRHLAMAEVEGDRRCGERRRGRDAEQSNEGERTRGPVEKSGLDDDAQKT